MNDKVNARQTKPYYWRNPPDRTTTTTTGSNAMIICRQLKCQLTGTLNTYPFQTGNGIFYMQILPWGSMPPTASHGTKSTV